MKPEDLTNRTFYIIDRDVKNPCPDRRARRDWASWPKAGGA